MRKLIVLAALVTAGLAGVVPAASAAGGVPTCLIVNGGSGGHLTKSLICAELVPDGWGRAATGRYSPGDTDTMHWITETIQFQPLGQVSSTWLPMQTTTQRGRGDLTATTRPVDMAPAGAMRACTEVGTGNNTVTGQVCTSAN
jgi:hypothetical protein